MRSKRFAKSWTTPGSNSSVVTAPVAPGKKTVTAPAVEAGLFDECADIGGEVDHVGVALGVEVEAAGDHGRDARGRAEALSSIVPLCVVVVRIIMRLDAARLR